MFLLCCQKANAIPTFLDSWRTEYPNSSSADVSCQLCHLQREGGSPWNAYGNDLRHIFNGLDIATRSIEDAFRMAEELNSDNDSPATSNIDEISANQQPAWRAGRVNLAFDRNGQEVGIFFPPITVDPFPTKITSTDVPLQLNEIATGFVAPIDAAVAPVTALRKQLFVADQIGIIWRVDLNTGEKSEYLDLSSRLIPLGAFQACGYDERGLIGITFHPQFATNGRLYVHTSQPASLDADFSTLGVGEIINHQSVISELRVANPTAKSGAAQLVGERDLMRIDQPQFNHNGGALVFDRDGMLYIGLGDGGGEDDQGVGHGASGNGGDPTNPFGSILRIDPLGNNSANNQYGIPSTNPFTNHATNVKEIFAYGLRNPWKLSVDINGTLLAADVGQNDIEELNDIKRGQHYGWPIKEGRFFFNDNDEFSGTITVEIPDQLPNITLSDPVVEYDHDEGISITGVQTYRGSRNPSLLGKTIFSDFNKRLFISDISRGTKYAMNLAPDVFIYSLAKDTFGELYVLGSETLNTCDMSSSGAPSLGKLIKLESTVPINDSVCIPIRRSTDSKLAVICL